jgi:hypothetical protein
MKQTSGEIARVRRHDCSLQRFQIDPALMLPSRPVLWGEARPVLGRALDFVATHPRHPEDARRGHDRDHCVFCFIGQPGPVIATRDRQRVSTSTAQRDMAISQVEAKQVRVGVRIERPPVTTWAASF